MDATRIGQAALCCVATAAVAAAAEPWLADVMEGVLATTIAVSAPSAWLDLPGPAALAIAIAGGSLVGHGALEGLLRMMALHLRLRAIRETGPALEPPRRGGPASRAGAQRSRAGVT